MADVFTRIIALLFGAFVVFLFSPLIGILFTGTIFFGLDGVWNGIVSAWDAHWALPGFIVFVLLAVGVIAFFYVLAVIIGAIFSAIFS